MKAFMLFTGSGPLVILTSHSSVTDPALLEKFSAKGIDKFIAHEIPLAVARERYAGHFGVVIKDPHENDDLRILDYNGDYVLDGHRNNVTGCATGQRSEDLQRRD